VKIAPSRKDGAEYQHRAARRLLPVVARSLQKVAGTGGIATVEALLPLRDPATGAEVPSYQLYTVIAWMRHVRLLKQHGKQGYSLAPSMAKDPVGQVAAAWERLPVLE